MPKGSLAATTPLRARRTQRERSAAMRSRLLDSAADCLFELGFSGTTTIVVAARAGVSRGAQLHHFPTKERLVTEAVRHLLAKRLAEFREAFAELPDGVDKPAAAIEILWRKLSGRTFYAWLELVVAARTDSALQVAMAEIAGHFLDEVRATANEFFAPLDGAPLPFEIVPIYALTLMQGLALDRIMWPADDARFEVVLSTLKLLAKTAIRVNDSRRLSRGAS
jgi:AcrR family transcriptional regulator